MPIAAGAFLMGTDDPDGFPADGEGPVREVTVSPFLCDAFCVTGYRFARFVAATGYVTEAELFGWSFVFHAHVPESVAVEYEVREVPNVAWWRGVPGACWAQPEGPGSTLAGRLDEPVAHVSWNDAVALARFEGGRVPTEAEWELAARGGLEQAIYCWGEELSPGGASTAATSGRGPSRIGTPPRTATPAGRRWTPSRPTDSACTTPPATSGSGARTGSRPTTGRTGSTRADRRAGAAR